MGSLLDLYPDPRRHDDLIPKATAEERLAGHWQRVGHYAAETRRGQSFGFAAALAALGVTAYLGHLGHAMAAAVVGGTPAVGLATAFAIGSRRASKNRDGPG